jgi:hypothetical protein
LLFLWCNISSTLMKDVTIYKAYQKLLRDMKSSF